MSTMPLKGVKSCSKPFKAVKSRSKLVKAVELKDVVLQKVPMDWTCNGGGHMGSKARVCRIAQNYARDLYHEPCTTHIYIQPNFINICFIFWI
jgi:hypothetical protein